MIPASTFPQMATNLHLRRVTCWSACKAKACSLSAQYNSVTSSIQNWHLNNLLFDLNRFSIEHVTIGEYMTPGSTFPGTCTALDDPGEYFSTDGHKFALTPRHVLVSLQGRSMFIKCSVQFNYFIHSKLASK